jgi:hypothetical protein
MPNRDTQTVEKPTIMPGQLAKTTKDVDLQGFRKWS